MLNESTIELQYCGKMDQICGECDAAHFKKERPADKKFSTCCSKGKVILPQSNECPELLLHLMSNSHPKSKHFMRKIRLYNSALAFASMGASIVTPPNRGPYCFRLHGQVYRNTCPVGAPNTTNPRYAQLYFIDSEQATEIRSSIGMNSLYDRALMGALDHLLRDINPFSHIYKTMNHVLEDEHRQAARESRPTYIVGMIKNGSKNTHDQRRYNRPTSTEITVVFKSVDGSVPKNRSIRSHLLIPIRGNKFVKIDPNARMGDPMTYPLFFPHGENDWHPYMLLTTTTKAERDR